MEPTRREVYLSDLQRVDDVFNGPQLSNGWMLRVFDDGTDLEAVACRDDGNDGLDALKLATLPRGQFASWSVDDFVLIYIEFRELRVYDTRRWKAWERDSFRPISVHLSSTRKMVRWRPGVLETASPENALKRFGLLGVDDVHVQVCSGTMRIGETFYDPFALTALTIHGTQGLECSVQLINDQPHLMVTNKSQGGLFKL